MMMRMSNAEGDGDDIEEGIVNVVQQSYDSGNSRDDDDGARLEHGNVNNAEESLVPAGREHMDTVELIPDCGAGPLPPQVELRAYDESSSKRAAALNLPGPGRTVEQIRDNEPLFLHHGIGIDLSKAVTRRNPESVASTEPPVPAQMLAEDCDVSIAKSKAARAGVDTSGAASTAMDRRPSRQANNNADDSWQSSSLVRAFPFLASASPANLRRIRSEIDTGWQSFPLFQPFLANATPDEVQAIEAAIDTHIAAIAAGSTNPSSGNMLGGGALNQPSSQTRPGTSINVPIVDAQGNIDESGPVNSDDYIDGSNTGEADQTGQQSNHSVQGGDLPGAEHIVPEAYLVEDLPSEEDNDLVISGYAEPLVLLPWWKQTRAKAMLGLMCIVIAAMAIGLGVSQSSKSSDSRIEVKIATTEPTQSASPTNGSSPPPSSSMMPSFSPSACSFQVSSKRQELDLSFLRPDNPTVAVDGSDMVVVTHDSASKLIYVVFFSFIGSEWERVTHFSHIYDAHTSENEKRMYSAALSGDTALVSIDRVYIYSKERPGKWERNPEQGLTDYKGPVDIEGDLIVVGGRADYDVSQFFTFRRGAYAWGQRITVDLNLGRLIRCFIEGNTIAVQEHDSSNAVHYIHLYQYVAHEVVKLQEFKIEKTHSMRSLSLGNGYLAYSSVSLGGPAVSIYHQEQPESPFSLLQRFESSDWNFGSDLVIDTEVLIAKGSDQVNIFLLANGIWQQTLVLDESHESYELSGRHLIALSSDEVNAFNVDEDCMTTSTNFPSASSAPSFRGTSAAPSSMPSSVRFTNVVEKLIPLSGGALKVQGSPQYKAAMWMADKDPIPNPHSSNGRGLDLDDPRFEQRYVMALFYYALDGVNWQRNQGWLGEASECMWFGVDGSSAGCGGDGAGGCINGGTGGDYSKICRISMSDNSLYGQLPAELVYLSEMRWFEVQNNYLLGTIPVALGSGWTKTITFLVGGNYLHGSFPQTFEYNQMLGTIFIDRNKFNGTFPHVFTSLENIEWIDADKNNFTGSLPAELSSLKSLRIINVNNNIMSGHLPDTWDENNVLEDFEIANNSFAGPLPPSLGKARFLKDLHASRNQLTGSIPDSYYTLENLEELYLDANLFVGELPQTAEPFYNGLQELSLSSNSFSGRFPVERLESTARIKVLSIHKNNFVGTISDNICERLDPNRAYSRLIDLSVDCDKISCTCCTCYDMNGDVTSVFITPTSSPVIFESPTIAPTEKDPDWVDTSDFSLNRPTRAPNYNLDSIFKEFIMEYIEKIVLQRGASFDVMEKNDPRYKALDWILYKDQRQLTSDDENLSQRYVLALMAFSLDSLAWHVCGEHRGSNYTEEYLVEDCEVEDDTGTAMHKVWLSSADECLWFGVTCSNDGIVRGVELMANDLIGELPPEICQLGSLQYLALYGNCLYGTVPPEVGKMKDLLSIELQGNGLSGSLPKEMYDIPKLQLLNVAMQFQYSLTCQMSNGTLVNTLYKGGGVTAPFEYNYGLLGDVMGPDVSKWTSMKGLHIYDNSFSGIIDESIGDLSNSLAFLRAQNNVFSGLIPSGIGNLKKLRELHLGKNGFHYDIPPTIGMMEDLEFFRIEETGLTGTIPDSLYHLRNLKKLWLHDTLSCGYTNSMNWECMIDPEVGFTGSIGTQIGNLTELSQLILHNNPIVGTLPTELGLCEKLSILYIDKTSIGGTVPDEVCRLRDKNLNDDTKTKNGVFYADCRPNNKTQDPFLKCSCCTDCCDHTTRVCIADD